MTQASTPIGWRADERTAKSVDSCSMCALNLFGSLQTNQPQHEEVRGMAATVVQSWKAQKQQSVSRGGWVIKREKNQAKQFSKFWVIVRARLGSYDHLPPACHMPAVNTGRKTAPEPRAEEGVLPKQGNQLEFRRQSQFSGPRRLSNDKLPKRVSNIHGTLLYVHVCMDIVLPAAEAILHRHIITPYSVLRFKYSDRR